MRQLLFIFSLFMLPLPGWTITPTPQVSRAYLYDDDHLVTIDSIADAHFTPYDGDLNLGFKNGAAWIRIEVTPPASLPALTSSEAYAGNPLALRVGPHYLDEITLYEQSAGKWLATRAGDLHSQPATTCADDFHCFILQGNLQQPQTVYLKIKTAGILTLESEVMPLDSLVFSSIKRVRQVSISLTVAGGLLVLGLIFYFRFKSSMLLYFCWFQVSIILFICSKTGILAQLLPAWPPILTDKLGHIFFVLRVYLHAAIGREIIVMYAVNSTYKKLIRWVTIISLANVLIIMIGQINFALSVTTTLYLVIPLIQIYGILSTPDISKRLRTILLAAYTIFFIVVGTGWLMSVGLPALHQNLIGQRGLADMRLNGIITSIFVFWVILIEQNIREISRAKDILKLRIEAAEAKANQEKLTDRNTLIDLLTHELKNPLGTIKFATTSVKRKLSDDPESAQRFKHIDLCILRMDKLIEQVARSSKIDQLDEPGPLESIPAAAIVNELIEEHANNKQLHIQIEDGLVFHTNREMLRVMLENLISNACKYAHPDYAINIRITRADKHISGSRLHSESGILFEISNMVGAYGAPDQTRLFERYYRHTFAQSISGLGIGLSLVKATAQKIGATIHYQYQDGRVMFRAMIPG